MKNLGLMSSTNYLSYLYLNILYIDHGFLCNYSLKIVQFNVKQQKKVYFNLNIQII